MAGARTTNYKMEKRNKELEKQRKKEAKQERKREREANKPLEIGEEERL